MILYMSSLLLLLATGCGVFYPFHAGGPYKGRVIDAETKQPLEGAVVLAVWDKEYPSVGGPVPYFLDSEEVLTDLNGRFVVGKHPPMTFSLAFVAGPRILIYSPGHGIYPHHRVSPKMGIGTDELLRMMEKEELIIELPRLTREERLYSIRDINDPDVPNEKKRHLLRLRNIERKELGLAGDNEDANIDTIIFMNGPPDEKTLDRLRVQYKRILIKKNGRYFNLDGTPTGEVHESDLPIWARELLRKITYAFHLQALVSEKTNVFEGSDFLPFCIHGEGSLIRIPDPVAKMREFFRLNSWKENDRYAADGQGSSSFAYEKGKYHCRILVKSDEAGIVPRRFGFEIYCREKL